jgi:hypothetical protein
VTTVRAYGGTPNKRAIARDVVRWFDSTQMPLPRNVHVIVRYSDRMSATECGSASWNHTGSSVTSRSFTVIINNAMLDVEKIIETLVHEMVHVHQMVSHTLRYRASAGSYSVYWKGTNHTRTGYMRQPWERQAYRLEAPLTRSYLNSGRLTLILDPYSR